MSRQRRLVVMRHAKAEQAAPSDYERALAPQGRRDASAAGRWLAGQGFLPDHVLVSGALRTRETWQHLRDAAGADWADLEADYDRGLYAAGVDTALDLLRLVDDEHQRVVVIAHNPTMAYLAQLLDDGDGDGGDQLTLGFPTSAAAVFDVPVGWADLAPGSARLSELHVSRG